LEIDEEDDKKKKRRLHESIQPIEKLDEDTDEIRRLMLKSTEEIVNNRWRMTRRDCSGNMNKPLQHKV